MKKNILTTTIAMAVLVASSCSFAMDTDAGPEPRSESIEVSQQADHASDTTEETDTFLEKAIAQALSKSGDGAESGKELDPQLKALLRHRESIEAMRQGQDTESGAENVLVPLASFLMIVLLVCIPIYLRYRRKGMESTVQKTAIEAGMQFIPELPASPAPTRNDKRSGLLIAGLGLAAALPLWLIGQPDIAVFGLAPIVIGVVYFVSGYLFGGERSK